MPRPRGFCRVQGLCSAARLGGPFAALVVTTLRERFGAARPPTAEVAAWLACSERSVRTLYHLLDDTRPERVRALAAHDTI